MELPVIGLNMDYSVYPKYPATDPQFRDCYDIYALYADAVADAGGLPMPVPCLQRASLQEAYLQRIDGFVFTGGEDYPPRLYGEAPVSEIDPAHPRRVASDLELVRRVLAGPMPVLGICGGMQLINIAAGGKLIQHLPSAGRHKAPSRTRDAFHPVSLEAGTRLAALLGTGPITVNSAHHQAVCPDHVGKGLRVASRAEDGVVEALEATAERFLIGVQWHPERMADSASGRRIFSALVSACTAG